MFWVQLRFTLQMTYYKSWKRVHAQNFETELFHHRLSSKHISFTAANIDWLPSNVGGVRIQKFYKWETSTNIGGTSYNVAGSLHRRTSQKSCLKELFPLRSMYLTADTQYLGEKVRLRTNVHWLLSNVAGSLHRMACLRSPAGKRCSHLPTSLQLTADTQYLREKVRLRTNVHWLVTMLLTPCTKCQTCLRSPVWKSCFYLPTSLRLTAEAQYLNEKVRLRTNVHWLLSNGARSSLIAQNDLSHKSCLWESLSYPPGFQ